MRKSISKFMREFLAVCLLISLCQPISVQAEEAMTELAVAPVETEVVAEETATPTDEGVLAEEVAILTDAEIMAEEGIVFLGDFRLTYYCCERRRHVCGRGTGITASGRPIEAGRSIAVDPEIIPLGSRVWIDFGDGAGWHEYSADDIGSLVKDNHIDIAIETHREALRQTKLTGRVCFCPPPSENNPAG